MLPTVTDLLRRAADQPERRESAIEEAFGVASRDGRWGELLSGLRALGLASPERLRRVMPAALEEACREGAPWGFREIAAAQAQDLADLEAAEHTLNRAEAEMEARSSSLGLCLIAEERADSLADVEGVRRCLERALIVAKATDDQAHVATVLATLLGETERARALVRALTTTDAHPTWSKGNALRSLGCPEEANSLLMEARQRLETNPDLWKDPCHEALTLASTARSWEDEGGFRRGLELAETLAGTPEQLLDIAETVLNTEQRFPVAARAIEEAERRASTGRLGQPRPISEELRVRLATLYALVGKAEDAARLAPAGLRPEQLGTPLRTLPGLHADAAGLLDHLRARLNASTLAHIAGADYGSEAPLHLAHLRRITETGRLPPTLRWNPGEVLRLCRWSSGERVNHVERAFCATVILLCSDQDSPGNDAPILVESALQLGPPCPALALGLLVWRYNTEPDHKADEQICALWGLALLIASRDPSDPALHTLADRLDQLAEPEAWGEEGTLERALRYTQKHQLWKHLIGEILEPEQARPAVRRILTRR